MIARLRLLVALGVATLVPVLPSDASASTFSPPVGALRGFTRSFKLDVALRVHLAIELAPADPSLDAAALAALDPASPAHRSHLDGESFARRFGRSPAEIAALVQWLQRGGAQNVYASTNRLVVGGDFTIGQAERALHTKYDVWRSGERTIVAPTTPLTLPVDRVRAVRGAIKAYTPRLAESTVPLPTDFRGAWYPAARFRSAYDAIPGGGAGRHIAILEDSSDRANLADVVPFARGEGAGESYEMAPPGTVADDAEVATFDPTHVDERLVTPPVSEQVCGRDDRGQEPTIDADGALALAPQAHITLRYDEICVRGGEGVVELQRTLDERPAYDEIVMPFAAAPLYGPLASSIGRIPIPYLEAALRGIPVVVAAGDDGAYGIHETGVDVAAVTYPCALPVVICAGGTQLGERRGNGFDDAPWNDGTHATGGGISLEARPAWQHAPEDFAFEHLVATRMVPDVSADASGHLLVFWHGYASGGIGGTSESSALVGAEIAAIDGAVPPERQILSAGDLYVLASAHPEAFRAVRGENDRSYRTNTLHPKAPAVPLDFHGITPTPPPTVVGCAPTQPHGCEAVAGYNPLGGLGSLLEGAAVQALGEKR